MPPNKTVVNQRHPEIVARPTSNGTVDPPNANPEEHCTDESPDEPAIPWADAVPDVNMEVDERENETILARLAAVAKAPSNDHSQGHANSPLNKYTNGTMLVIHDIAPMTLLEGIDEKQLGTWLQTATGKVLARPFDLAVGYQPNHPAIAKTLIAAVNEITGQNNIAVAAPIRSKHYKKKHPITFLIHNLSPDGASMLLEKRVWSSIEISFQVAPLNQDKPNFLFTLTGILTQELDHVKPLMAAAWVDRVTGNFVKELIEQTPPGEQKQLALDIDNFLRSTTVAKLDIKSKGGKGDPHFNLYADSKFLKKDDTWIEIRNFLKGRVYHSQLYRKGEARENFFYCSLCHGRDHPRGLCQFPKLPGWNGGGRNPLPPTNLIHNDSAGPSYSQPGPRRLPPPYHTPNGNGRNAFPRRSL